MLALPIGCLPGFRTFSAIAIAHSPDARHDLVCHSRNQTLIRGDRKNGIAVAQGALYMSCIDYKKGGRKQQ